MALLIDPQYYIDDHPDSYPDEIDDYDNFRSFGRPRSHYRGIAPRYTRPRGITRGKAPQSIFIPPGKLRALKAQAKAKKNRKVAKATIKKTAPPKKAAKAVATKKAAPKNKKKQDTAKMIAAKKAMQSDTKAATPAKVIAIIVAVTGTIAFSYLVWKQYKKQTV